MTISRPLAGFTNDSIHALPLHVLDRDGFAAWSAQQPAAVQAWLPTEMSRPEKSAVAVSSTVTSVFFHGSFVPADFAEEK